MQISVKTCDEQGNVIFEGAINSQETGFLLQYAINDLLMAGVTFHLDKPSEDEEGKEEMRMEFPKSDGEFH